MTTYPLSHITDLANIEDQDIAEFARNLPTLIGSLKLMKQQCALEGGAKLADVLPSVTFVPEMGDKVVIKAGGVTQVEVTGEQIEATRSRMRRGH